MSWMQHRQTSEPGPFVSWRKIPTIVQLEDGGFALASSGTNALAINNALVKFRDSPGGTPRVSRKSLEELTASARKKGSNNLIEHEDAPPDIYAASGPA